MRKGAYKTTYDNEKSYWWYQARADIVQHVFSRNIFAPDMEILNLGCGTGLLNERFSEFGPVTGIDYKHEALEFCSRNRFNFLVRADAAALPFRDQSFNACLALDMIEHLPDDKRALNEIKRVLKPGGSVLLTAPAFQWMWSGMDAVGEHIRRYTRPQIKELLAQAGLQAAILSYYNFFLSPLAFVYKLKEWILREEVTEETFLPVIPPALNRILYVIFNSEKNWLGRVNFPFGLSIMALARKNQEV